MESFVRPVKRKKVGVNQGLGTYLPFVASPSTLLRSGLSNALLSVSKDMNGIQWTPRLNPQAFWWQISCLLSHGQPLPFPGGYATV